MYKEGGKMTADLILQILIIILIIFTGIIVWYVETHNIFEYKERQQDDNRRKKTKRN